MERFKNFSATKIMDFFKTPLEFHYWHVEKNERETPSMNEGKMLHEMILEPLKFASKYYGPMNEPEGLRLLKTVSDLKDFLREHNFPTSGLKPELEDRCATFIEESKMDLVAVYSYWVKKEFGDKIQIPLGTWKNLEKMRNRIMNQPFVKQQMREGDNIFEIEVEGELCGRNFRGRLDWVIKTEGAQDIIIDLKRVRSAKPRLFSSAIYDSGYFIQAAIYRDLWKAQTKRDSIYVWVAVEPNPPYHCEVYVCDFGTLEAGLQTYQSIIEKIDKCCDLNNWPGYNSQTASAIAIPTYAMEQVGHLFLTNETNKYSGEGNARL